VMAVTIVDMRGVPVFLNRGGVQVLAKLGLGSGQPVDFVPVPAYELYANEERNLAALNIALGPLVMKTATPEGPK
jgi:hypothetical protein